MFYKYLNFALTRGRILRALVLWCLGGVGLYSVLKPTGSAILVISALIGFFIAGRN